MKGKGGEIERQEGESHKRGDLSSRERPKDAGTSYVQVVGYILADHDVKSVEVQQYFLLLARSTDATFFNLFSQQHK